MKSSIGILEISTLPNVQNVADASRFVVGVPVGVKSINKLGFELSGTVMSSALIDTVDVSVNGTPIQAFQEAVHAELIQDYYGEITPADRFALQFGRSHLTRKSERELFFIGCADVDTLQIQGNIAGATAPAIAAYEQKTVLQQVGEKGQAVANRNRLGLFTKVKNFTYTLTGAGTTEVDNIPREAFLQALHLIQSADVITNVEAWVDGRKIWDASKARMTNEVQDAGRTKQASTYHLDWMLENELGSQLPLVGSQDFRLKIAHSGGATVNLYAEYLSTFAGI
ncbi:MAG: hypothetical protein KBT88_03520 [Gammaproteobacteria bacterium]|nr:hypothetical protein [Gammaproteobacteria bacterium]MBQ0838830.1 hypothetical protein [Gammaproteobacteria bacterium]